MKDFFPHALGHDYWNGDIPPLFGQLRNEGAGHSDYWRKNKNKKERALSANRVVKDFLDFATRGIRIQASRTETERDPRPERDLGD